MKKKPKILLKSCLVLALLNLVWLGYNTYKYLDIPKLVASPAITAKIIYIGLLLFFISHLIIIIVTMTSLKISRRLSFAGILLLGIGAVSFIMLFFHFLALDDMADSIQAGYSHKGLLKMLWTTIFFHFSFYIFGVIYFILLLRAGSGNIAVKSVFREKIFISTHITGVVCGILGIFITFLLLVNFNERNVMHRFLILPFGFVLFPYLLALGGWGYCFIKDLLSGQKDEKQLADLNRAGMVALPVSAILMIGFTVYSFQKADIMYKSYYFSGEIPVLWLPLILFITLVVFSVSSLYNYKLN